MHLHVKHQGQVIIHQGRGDKAHNVAFDYLFLMQIDWLIAQMKNVKFSW